MSSAPDAFPAPLQPLRGLRLVDLSRYVPGPFCSLLCAELGCEVIKVESPGSGDPLRAMDRRAFESLNRGKKSLALDLKAEAGRKVLLELMRGTDVLIEGFRPGALARLDIELEALLESFPRLVVVSISGYGQRGPYRERAGHDINYMAVGGALGDSEAPPAIQVADFAAGGLYGTIAILAAIMEREASGRGRYIDLSMLEGVRSFLALAGSTAGSLLSGRAPNYGIYRTRDGGRLALGALEPKFWKSFCLGLSRPDLIDRISDPDAREEVADELSRQDRAFWEERFRDLDACIEPVVQPAEALQHQPGLPLPFRSTPATASSPDLGQHSRDLLTEIGLTPTEIESMVELGVTSFPPSPRSTRPGVREREC